MNLNNLSNNSKIKFKDVQVVYPLSEYNSLIQIDLDHKN